MVINWDKFCEEKKWFSENGTFFKWDDEGNHFSWDATNEEGSCIKGGEGSEGLKQAAARAKYWGKERLDMVKELSRDLGE